MMKQQFKSCVWLILMLLGMTQTAHAAFQDFAVKMTDSWVDTSVNTFYVAVAADGTPSVVENEADATFKWSAVRWNDGQHGWVNPTITVKVDGPVKVGLGYCKFGAQTASITDAEGNKTEFQVGTTDCWNASNIEGTTTYCIYKGTSPTTLTIYIAGYAPYISVEAVDPSTLAEEATVSFGTGDASGIAPESIKKDVGATITLPKNYTLYKEGYTLTGWSDGTDTYATGAEYTVPSSDITLTPVFTQNTVSLADRTDAVTLKWDFQRNNGAPIVQWQNTNGNVWVTQATVNGSTIDVPMTIDTNPGKFNNSGNTDCSQTNNGTVFTIPSCKGATVETECHGSFTISTTTIDGQTDYTGSGTSKISYEIANTADNIQIVIGDGSYYKYVKVTLPVVEQSGGASYDHVDGTITWAVGNEETPAITTEVAEAVSIASVSVGNGLTATNQTYLNTSMIGYQPTTGNAGAVESVMIEYRVQPKAGLKFTPAEVSYYAVKDGTDNATYKWSYTVDGVESSITEVSKDDIVRNNNTTGTPPMLHTHDLNVSECSEFTFRIYVSGFGNNKKLGIGNVVIGGTFNGTAADVNKYTLSVVPSDAAAGTVTAYPAAVEYEEGTTVKLTATPNFGYHFVNWTDGENNVLSTDAVYNHEMTADIAITANFEAVQTYELALTVDGTNDYMVTIDPLPTIVNDKMMYEAGTVVTLTANQYAGLVTFNNWSDAETNSQKTITMDENKTYTAVYSQNDIIAGWDFYVRGNDGRVADFASADNESASLNLVQTGTTNINGWLDKSTVAANGYESFKGAAVNWRTGEADGDVGNWHWQTKVNAEAFQNINVQFQMMYNYNAYKVYDAEYSLDGTNWTRFGSIEMTGAKAAASFSEQLPAECNNAPQLYIRMLADKTSDVDGAASKNDGNTLAMFFITGTEQVAYDAVAPALVSTIPANNGTGASATGRIVLTFDKKVQLAANAKGNLDGAELTPTAMGKSVTFSYSQLDYNTAYTFTLPANSVENLSGVALGEAVTINFTTMARPTVEKGLYDAVVSNVTELLQAIDDAAKRADKNVRYRIFIKNGNYTIPLYSTMKTCNGFDVQECITFLTNSHNNVSFIGESRDGVVITNAIPADATFAGLYGPTSKYDGIGNSDVFQSRAEGLYWQDLTVSTGMEDSRGRDIAIQDQGNKTIYKNVCLHGYQDTWTANNSAGLFYFEGGIVRGRTDYLCGKGDAFFNGVELLQVGTGGYPIVPSQPKSIGWVFKDCELTPETSDVTCTLGRPWGNGTPAAYLINTKMNVVPSAAGWNEMSGGWPYRFAEYNSYTASGSQIDLSERKTTFGGHENCNKPVLTAEEAAYYSDMSNMFGDWQPTLATEQAPVPTNVTLSGTTLSWTGSNYALLYAICKNGNVVDFSTDETFTVDDATATWTVRAANEMGGLSEAAEAAVGIELVLDDTSNGNGAKIVEANGQTVNVKVERTLSSQYYNTLFLPFAMTAEQIKAAFGEGVQVATFTGMNSETQFGFTNVTAMEANTGYLVKPAAAVNGFTVEGVTITSAASVTPSSDWIMYGSYDTFNNDETKEVYDFTTKNTVKELAATGSIKGLRAFMMKGATEETVKAINSNVNLIYGGGSSEPAQARADFFLYLDGGTTTGINSIENGQIDNDAPAYNLAGQKVGKGYKGIVIKNGKKVVMK
jgi:hypothetical protein